MATFRHNPRRSTAQKTHSLRNAPIIGFDPRKLEEELLIWLRADMGIELNGSTIEGWDDQSGNGNDFEQTGDASAQPDPETGLGGRATVYFDNGNGEFMSGPSFVGTVSTANDWTIVVVANEWEWGTSGSDYSFTARKLIGTRNAPFVPGGTNLAYFSTGVGTSALGGWCGGYYNTGLVHVNAKSAAAGVEGIPIVYVLINDGGELTCRLNGVDGDPVTGGSIQAQAGYMDLAGWSTANADSRFGGTMSEVLIFDGSLSDGEMASLETYLSERYSFEVS